MKFINNTIKLNNTKQMDILSKKFNVQSHIIRHLFAHGLKTEKEISQFLEPSLSQFYNPFLLDGMNEAVKVIKCAIENKKRIVIVGDYDTDGICATAILYKYFESINIKVDYFLPNRFLDGYGLTIEAINKIIELYNPELVITVDCGIACYKEIEVLKNKNIEVIVTDHHEIPEILPNCITIDPKNNKNKYPFSELCGAGVALKVVHALGGLKEFLKYANIATIATVADIVPLINENRALVKYGLKTQDTLPIGIKKLFVSLQLKEITSTDIAFKIAPKLNTAGRMGDASLAFSLFIENNNNKISEIIKKLDNQNSDRVDLGNQIYEESIEMLKDINISNIGAIVLHSNHWHNGVLGIVCAKLTDKFNRPVCLLSEVEGVYKGSIRSINGIDIYKELTKVSSKLVKFGGHSGAGGLTIEEKNIESFTNELNKNILKSYPDSTFELVKYYDIDMNKEIVDINFLKSLDVLEPFGFCNEKPIFKYSFNNLKPERIKNHPNYFKIKTENFEMLSFNLSNNYSSLNTNCNKEVLLDLSIDTYKNAAKVKGIIKYINYYKLNTNIKNEESSACYLSQLVPANTNGIKNNNITELSALSDINNLLNRNLGTLIVANTFESYLFAINNFSKNITNYDTFSVKSSYGINTLIYLPTRFDNFNNYNNIVFLDEVLTLDYLNNFSNNIYLYCINKQNCINDISVDRKTFAIYHTAITNCIKNNLQSYSVMEYFYSLKKLNPQFKNLKLNQFQFVIIVLKELKIIEIINEIDKFNIVINNNVNNPLTNSKIYNFVSLLSKLK